MSRLLVLFSSSIGDSRCRAAQQRIIIARRSSIVSRPLACSVPRFRPSCCTSCITSIPLPLLLAAAAQRQAGAQHLKTQPTAASRPRLEAKGQSSCVSLCHHPVVFIPSAPPAAAAPLAGRSRTSTTGQFLQVLEAMAAITVFQLSPRVAMNPTIGTGL